MHINTYVVVSDYHVNICFFMYISIYIHIHFIHPSIHPSLDANIHICMVGIDYIPVCIQVHMIFI